ncbi:MAG: DUF4135 domain-containing protein [Gammaproteobacteria bacterium]|nr:DUF4135 domain-containing protein [Gammaproteobacteria bacterium]
MNALHARTLHERITAAGKFGATVAPRRRADDLTAMWRQCLGGAGALESRIADLNLGPVCPEAVLGTFSTGASAHWLGFLREAIAYTPTRAYTPNRHDPLTVTPAKRSGAVSGDAMQQAFTPFLQAACARLVVRAGKTLNMLSRGALASLERQLLLSLSALAAQAIEQESELRAALAGEFPWTMVAPNDSSLERLGDGLAFGGWKNLLCEYPVLGRLLAARAERWVEDISTVLGRLSVDAPDAGLVEQIELSCGDTHAGGRTVTLLLTSDGTRRVYKARSLALEKWFQQLLKAVNGWGYSTPFRILSVVDRGAYGWMESVVPVACRDTADIDGLQRRAGGLLCLLGFLQATDIHRENVIFAGAQPVIIDLETLIHPRLPAPVAQALGVGSIRLQGAAGDPAWLETGILPILPPATGASAGATLAKDFSVLRALPASPARDDNLIAGFKEMYHLVSGHKDALLARIDALQGMEARVVVRSTSTYHTLLQHSLQPALLRDGAARGICFEVLRAAALRENAHSQIQSLVDAELQALENFDVPCFTYTMGTPCDRPHLLASLFAGNPLDEVRKRISTANPETLPALINMIAAVVSGRITT